MGKLILIHAQEDACPVGRLTIRNFRRVYGLRFHPDLGYIAVSVVGFRYFDRGAGGFMSSGAYVYEGRVVCGTFSRDLDEWSGFPAVVSKAGWGFSAGANTVIDGNRVVLEDHTPSTAAVEDFDAVFWAIEGALDYTTGEEGSAIGRAICLVRVCRTRDGYTNWSESEATLNDMGVCPYTGQGEPLRPLTNGAHTRLLTVSTGQHIESQSNAVAALTAV